MEVLNQTTFHLAPLVGRLNFPGHSLTVIVKGTFDLQPDKTVTISEKQLFPTGDEFYPDDEEMQGSCRYESDFAYFKPKADLLLAGHCHCPDGQSAPACQVKFRAGSHEKTLNVFGERRWERPFGIRTISDPEPFTRMALRYENSYGGQGYKKNPVGKGYSKQVTEDGEEVTFLPNIDAPQTIMETLSGRPEPEGFAPLGRMWKTRASKMGTYKDKYMEERWPWFPNDFDWGHFNAAPADMQVDGYLRGDESLCFENLHPEVPEYSSRLPGLRVRCFANIPGDSESIGDFFKEIRLNLDTLWVDMDNEKLVLVWRGWMEVLSEDYEEIERLFIMSESVDEPARTIESCYQAFLKALSDYEKMWASAPRTPGPVPEYQPEEEIPITVAIKVPVAEADEPAEALTKAKARAALTRKFEARTAAILSQAGVDMAAIPPHIRKKTLDKQAAIIQQLTEDDPAKLRAMQQAEIEARMKDAFSKMGVDVDNPPPVSAKAKAEQTRFMKALGIHPALFARIPQLEKMMAAMPAVLPKMGVDPEDLTPVIAKATKHQEELFKRFGVQMEDGDETAAGEEAPEIVLTRQIVERRAALGESFAHENLEELDLSELDLHGLDFTGTCFSGACLRGANLAGAVLVDADLKGTDLTGARCVEATLEGAQLSEANLEGADFTSANLARAHLAAADLSRADLTQTNLSAAVLSKTVLEKACLMDANFTGSDLSECVLSRADLKDAIFEKADLKGAALKEVQAADANFSAADLTHANLGNGDFSGADFSKSTLDGVDFSGAKLEDASVEGARGLKANFNHADLTRLRASEGCDFTESSFRESKGAESIWHDAVLKDADFSRSNMAGADFTKAFLQNADFSAVDMPRARFIKADMKGARLMYVNLFKGSLEKADLAGADLSGSNMYGAEFLEAVTAQTKLAGTNLKRTKLERRETPA